MSCGQVSPVSRFLSRVAACEGGDAPDRHLLERFAAARDPAAFAALVRRHGPMVLGVCRRVLGNLPDAEDAFQATFLVLVHKAGAIGRPEQLGNWLYGVAYRTAVKARGAAARRRGHERRAGGVTPADPAHEADQRELRAVLDEELAGLAEKYRAPVVLCYLEGLTTDEAARRLGCPRGTVLSRLARGRERLRRRLVRRGLALSAGAFAGGLAQGAVPAELAERTAETAARAAAGGAAAAGAVPVSVAALTKGVLRAMFLTKLKTAAAVLVAVGVVGTIAVVGAHAVLAERPADAQKQGEAKPATSNAAKPKADAGKSKTDKERLQGTWKMVAGEVQGREATEDELRRGHLVIKGDKLTTVRPDGTSTEADYQLDPEKKPKTIDVIPQEGPENERGKTFRGIYLLDGDTLKLCMNGPEMERPTEFKTAEGTRLMLFTLKREAGGK